MTTRPSSTERNRFTHLGCAVVLLIVVSCQGSSPDVAHYLDWTLGTWEGVRRDVADETEAAMIMRVEPLAGGGGQIRALEVRGGGSVYHGTSVQRFDGATGTWLWQYTNSATRAFALYRGRIEADRGVWRSISPGRQRESRLMSERLAEGRWRRREPVSRGSR
jgi:hypothetical protein